MLFLTSKEGEGLVLHTASGTVLLCVLAVRGDVVRLGIQAPEQITVLREELPGATDADEPLPVQGYAFRDQFGRFYPETFQQMIRTSQGEANPEHSRYYCARWARDHLPTAIYEGGEVVPLAFLPVREASHANQ